MTKHEQVLVANRGEIALRVMRTCRRLGLATVAVYTDADVDAPHVRFADAAHRVESYLDMESVLAAPLAPGARVHPGYGFLSENAAFAEAVAEHELVFVGPPVDVIARMGRKDAARAIAVEAGVPVVPTGEDAGYPVLVKAAAGGGGKGMRVVRSESELAEATDSAKREARAAFGDDTMLLEKWVEEGRHIEVQVFGDTHGNVVHLGERDCSVQRRHQKVIEEAPAPTISPETREVVTQAAVALAGHVGYVGAGTVEFLLDVATGEAYFLEMNTRLQVEHPVTEAVVRVRGAALDMVELQLRVAAGEPLGFDQDDVSFEGHAIEARVYAEDPTHDFLPQAGTASLVRWPAESDEVRVDHALEPGQRVGTSYDPMLGKVIAHGPDRETARNRLREALEETAILGLTTNVGYLAALIQEPVFVRAGIHTSWLDRFATVPLHQIEPQRELARVLVAWTSAMITAFDAGHPFQSDGFRLGSAPAATVVELDRPVVVDRAAGTVDGVPVHQLSAENHVLDALVDTRRVRAVVNVQPDVLEVALAGQRHVFTPPDRLAGALAVSDGTITAPMPGTVLSVAVEQDAHVQEGATLGVLEAMKMELSLKAPFAGTVTGVGAREGEQVSMGAALFVVEPDVEEVTDA